MRPDAAVARSGGLAPVPVADDVRAVAASFAGEAQAFRAGCGPWSEAGVGDARGALLLVPDVGPSCEILLADRLLHDLEAGERDGLLASIRQAQGPSGAWLDARGEPDLSVSILATWVLLSYGADPKSEALVRAVRAVHAGGGAQRASFVVRLWLALAGAISWDWLPSVPAELWLLPQAHPMSPCAIPPWAREILAAYVVLASVPARFQLGEAGDLLLRQGEGALVLPRLTRPGFAGDLLQALDRGIKLGRRLPRGPLRAMAREKVLSEIRASQQDHGGWFSFRPTLYSILALRASGTASDDPCLVRALAHLRALRGHARAGAASSAAASYLQGVSGTPVELWTRFARLDLEPDGSPSAETVRFLLSHELTFRGPWQARADVAAGGWPLEFGSERHVDLAATCAAIEVLRRVTPDDTHASAVHAALRRAGEVVYAMQDLDGSFSRFERREHRVFLQRFPWRDADLLAHGDGLDESRVCLTATAITALARLGAHVDDDRIGRALDYLALALDRLPGAPATSTLTALAGVVGALSEGPTTRFEELFRRIDRLLRARQREDGSFGAGTLHETACGLFGLLSLAGSKQTPCVQAARAAKWLMQAADSPSVREQESAPAYATGFGPSVNYDPSAPAREAALALFTFAARGGALLPAAPPIRS